MTIFSAADIYDHLRRLRGERVAPRPAPEAPAPDVEDLIRSEAHRDPKHPDHLRISAQVREFYEAQPGGDEPVA